MTSEAVISDNELRYQLALWRVPQLGAASFARILKHYGDIETCFREVNTSVAASYPLLESWVEAIRYPNWHAVDRDLAWQASAPNRHIMRLSDDDYPLLLNEISHPPPLLFIAGEREVLARKQIAVVGSRRPTLVGLETARLFAMNLVEHDWVITSGLAHGIDGAAHKGALDANGKTVAVLGCGLDRVYPREHAALMAQCTYSGAVVSMFPCGIPPVAAHFPRRNQIVSGLSKGVLVVEASKRSGSLITARCGNEQNRDVFAIPGSIYSEQSQGCLQLIQEGAKCVTHVDDILSEYLHERYWP